MTLFDIPIFFLLSFGGGVLFFAWLWLRAERRRGKQGNSHS